MNCFAYSKKGCKALTVKACLGDSCRFRKTPEQAAADRRRSLERIASMDEPQKSCIANTYYSGKLPKPEEVSL